MKLLKKHKYHLLITAILLIFILCTPFQDYQNYMILESDMTADENYAYADCYLAEGTYDFKIINYATAEDTAIEFYAPETIAEDGQAGQVLQSIAIPAKDDFTVTDVSFPVEDAMLHLQIRMPVLNVDGTVMESVYYQSEPNLYKDPYILAVLVLLASALFLWYREKKNISLGTPALLLGTALLASIPIGYTWLLDGQDLYFHYGRLANLILDLKDGSFPILAHGRLFSGFGYASPIFYPELFLYVPAFLGVLGMSPIGCYKVLIFLIQLATAGIACYSFTRLCKSRQLGLTASVLYTLSIYRLIDLYTRAAIGEAMAMIFLPLLLLGMYELIIGDSKKWWISVLAFTGLLQSHMITTEIALGFSALFALLQLKRIFNKERIRHILLGAGCTILLNLWFLVPLLSHLRYPVSMMNDVYDLTYHTVYLSQIFDFNLLNPAGYALEPGEYAGEMPYSIGLTLLLGCIAFLFLCFRQKKKEDLSTRGKWLFAFGLIAIYASSVYFPWGKIQSFPVLHTLAGSIQFPFRLLAFATVFLVPVSVIGFSELFAEAELKKASLVILCITAAFTAFIYIGRYCEDATGLVYNGNMWTEAMKTDNLYIMGDTEGLNINQLNKRDASFLPEEGVTVSDCSRGSLTARFQYTKNIKQGYVDIPLNFYPNYRAYDETGNALPLAAGERARIRVILPEASEGTVTVVYEVPYYYWIAGIVSIGTLLGLSVASFMRRRKIH